MAFVNEKTEDGKYITIDRGRNLKLSYVDQVPREPLYIFEFNSKGSEFSFWARQSSYLSDNKERTIQWAVCKILSEHWANNGPDIKENMIEALKCFGSTGAAETRPESIKEVIVEFAL